MVKPVDTFTKLTVLVVIAVVVPLLVSDTVLPLDSVVNEVAPVNRVLVLVEVTGINTVVSTVLNITGVTTNNMRTDI